MSGIQSHWRGRGGSFAAVVPGNRHMRPGFFTVMPTVAQTDAATRDRLYGRWECTLVAKVNSNSRRSKAKFRSQPVWNFWFAASLNLIVRPKDCAGKVLLSRRAHAHDPALPSAPATQKTALPQWRPFPAGSRSSVGQVLTAVYQERYLALDHPAEPGT